MPEMPVKPEPPQEEPESSGRGGSWWMVMLAVMLAVFFAGGLIVLSMGAFSWVIALGLGIFLFAALHYLLWGWWLGGVIHRDVAREEEEQS